MLYSYVSKTSEQGWTGVSRFDGLLRRVFPEMISSSVYRDDVITKDDVVITDNHLSLAVPDCIKTIVVHHGSAAVHYVRDNSWRNLKTSRMVGSQLLILALPNRTFVAPSQWVSEKFGGKSNIIPHWVEPISALPKSGKPIIIGDWRDNNKGSNTWRKIAAACPQWEFQPLSFRDDAGRRKQYGEASLYLCLSLSEGGSYAMCDAEAASLPVVSTDVGNYLEFDDCEVISWKDRDNVELVSAAIERKLKAGRNQRSFYNGYSFEMWAELWRAVVQ